VCPPLSAPHSVRGVPNVERHHPPGHELLDRLELRVRTQLLALLRLGRTGAGFGLSALTNPASLTEPLSVRFTTQSNDDDRPEFVADHPWGWHRRRIPDRVVFDHVLAALVHGSGYERIATPGCSDRTIRRRLLDWTEREVGVELLKAALAAYDQMIGLNLDDLSVDGSITKSPYGGELSGRSPVDRGKQGTKRSVVTDGRGIPLALVGAGANRHDSPLFEPTMRQIPDMIGVLPDQPCVHPDRGCDSTPTRDLLDELGYVYEIARKPIPAPIQAGKTVGRGTHPLLDERLRQDPPLHRETPRRCRAVPAPRRRPHRPAPPHQRSPHPLPLANPTHHPKTQVTINCRAFLVAAPTEPAGEPLFVAVVATAWGICPRRVETRCGTSGPCPNRSAGVVR